MARIKKEPEIRRAELIDTARKLFSEKGYSSTSVSDIVKTAGVAQGTFYWYFKSKEEILDAVAESISEQIFGGVQAVLDTPGLKADEKLWKIFESMNTSVEKVGKMVDEFHSPKYSRYHDRIARIFIKRLIPIFSGVISEGVAEGVFDTPSPEMAAIFILATGLYTDEDLPSDEGISIEHFSAEYMEIIRRVLGLPGLPGDVIIPGVRSG